MHPVKEKVKEYLSNWTAPDHFIKWHECVKFFSGYSFIYIELPNNKWTLIKAARDYDNCLELNFIKPLENDAIHIFHEMGYLSDFEMKEFWAYEQKCAQDKRKKEERKNLTELKRLAKAKGYKLVKED